MAEDPEGGGEKTIDARQHDNRKKILHPRNRQSGNEQQGKDDDINNEPGDARVWQNLLL